MQRHYLPGLMAAAVLAAGPACTADVTLVSNGQARAVIVVPAEALPVVRYAAAELQYHVQKASGVELQVVSETGVPAAPAAHVYLGSCAATERVGLRASELAPETFLVRTVGANVFIAGGDSDGKPVLTSTRAGTLFGVYDLLENVLHVHWLWPGELGEVVPKTETIVVADGETYGRMHLLRRGLRTTLRGSRVQLAYSRQAGVRARQDEAVWLRRQRMGQSVEWRYGHAFTGWWAKYGKSHPEYFNRLPDGERRPDRHATVVSMCVSEPRFWEQIVDNWWDARQKGGPANVNVCENDVCGLCTCERCRTWDEPLPAEPPDDRYKGPDGRVVSNRYARYYRAVQQLAAKRDPAASVVGYAYVNYFPAPSAGIKLNDRVFVGLVPDTFFPRAPKKQQWVLAQWEGWGRTGAQLFLRPNYFLDGYCLPYIFAHQFGEEFGHAARHGMVGTDFDSLTGMWAAQGPNLYLLGRMHVKPLTDVDVLLREYYDAFGAAGDAVRAYFDYWQQVTRERDARRKEVGLGWQTFPRAVHEVYTPELFVRGRELLDIARRVVTADTRAVARVEFLGKGLEHARLTVETSQRLAEAKKTGDTLGGVRAVQRLDDFRSSIEDGNVANLAFCNWIEQRSWDRGLAEEARGKTIIAQLPVHWRMQWDPREVGQAEKWYAPGTDTSDWLTVRTDAAWEKQQVGEQWKAEHDRDYDGLAWYRTEFTVDSRYKGGPLALVFGAVDETATVYLNGRLAGRHVFTRPEDWYMPFTIPATEHLRFDAPNVLVVLVEDRSGLGGVWKPVILVSD